MVDVYFCSMDKDILASFCSQFCNVIGPFQGVAAVEEQSLEDGSVIPAKDAVGDPDQYYACVRADNIPTLPEGISAMAYADGAAVLGVWA